MMERRLFIAKELLDTLQVGTDRHYQTRKRCSCGSGCYWNRRFPRAMLRWCHPSLTAKALCGADELTRTNEFIYLVKFGSARLTAEREQSGELRLGEPSEVRKSSPSSPWQNYGKCASGEAVTRCAAPERGCHPQASRAIRLPGEETARHPA